MNCLDAPILCPLHGCLMYGWMWFVDSKVEVQRSAGLNDVGMVAWIITLRTPEYPEGRQAILIANDITYQVCILSCVFCLGGLFPFKLNCNEKHLGQQASVLGAQLMRMSTLCPTFETCLPQAGSFGTREDMVFYLASRLAREKGLPRCG